MDKNARLIARLQRILNRLQEDSKAATLLQDVIDELQDDVIQARDGGGNGNGPPK
jgi:hypothetical protein